MKILLILSALLASPVAYDSVLAQDDSSSESIHSNYISNINSEIINHNSDKEFESPLRRFEITFFISLPFVFILNFLVLHIFEVIKQGNPDVSVWEEHDPLLITSTVTITSLLSLREAIIYRREKNIKKIGEASKNNTIFLSFTMSY